MNEEEMNQIVDPDFDGGDWQSVMSGLADLRGGAIEYEHPVQMAEILRSLWDPEYGFVAFHLVQDERWDLGMTDQFTKDISKVDKKIQGRILQALARISEEPSKARGPTIKPLTGDFSGMWRCRIGDYRLVYFPDPAARRVTLISFASRGSVYEP